MSSFRLYESCGSVWWRTMYSASCLAGNSVSHTKWKSLAKCVASPSTKDVSNVTLAAFRLPAGKFSPIFSSFSLSSRPPFLLLALREAIYDYSWWEEWQESQTHLRSTPPRREAFKHSGGDSRRCTSAMVTLYFDVLDRRLRRPGTAQNTSLGEPEPRFPDSFPLFMPAKKRK